MCGVNPSQSPKQASPNLTEFNYRGGLSPLPWGTGNEQDQSLQKQSNKNLNDIFNIGIEHEELNT